MTSTTCSCASAACAFRAARGLVPFCLLPTPAPRVEPGYDTYGEALAALKPGQRVQLISRQGSGGPRRFDCVELVRS